MYNVKDLCNKLNEAGIPCVTYDALEKAEGKWTPKNDMITSLRNLPDKNFDKLVEMDYAGIEKFGDAYNEWGRRGYLKFDPYVRTDDEDDNPTLTIRHDRHLHMFRGYHFQASGTPSGIGSHGIGSYRTDFLLNHKYYVSELWKYSVLANMLCYAALFDVAFTFDNFRDWFMRNPKSVDEFLHKSMESWRMSMQYDWEYLNGHIHTTDNWVSPDRRLYRLEGKGKIFCEFAFGVKTIQVRTVYRGEPEFILTLYVPDAFEGVDTSNYEEDDLEDFRRDVTIVRRASGKEERVDIRMLLIMLLSLKGVHLNWTVWYRLSSIQPIKGTNVPGVKVITNLNDLDDCEPDEF